jgi:ribosomal protein S18 acetylase RimI-like enzyme
LATDVESLFSVRSRTRESGLSKEQLADIGITPELIAEGIAAGEVVSWVCTHDSSTVGFCNGNTETGEVLVLAVLPEYERRGVGKRLLAEVVGSLRSVGCRRVWLAATSNPTIRAYGFYRHLGWRPTGKTQRNGDQILILEDSAAPAER